MSYRVNFDIDVVLAIGDPAGAGEVVGRLAAAIEAALRAEPAVHMPSHRVTTRTERM